MEKEGWREGGRGLLNKLPASFFFFSFRRGSGRRESCKKKKKRKEKKKKKKTEACGRWLRGSPAGMRWVSVWLHEWGKPFFVLRCMLSGLNRPSEALWEGFFLPRAPVNHHQHQQKRILDKRCQRVFIHATSLAGSVMPWLILCCRLRLILLQGDHCCHGQPAVCFFADLNDVFIDTLREKTNIGSTWQPLKEHKAKLADFDLESGRAVLLQKSAPPSVSSRTNLS